MDFDEWGASVYNADFSDEMAKAVEKVAREYDETLNRAITSWAEQAGVSTEEVLRMVTPSVSLRANGRMVSIHVHAVPREVDPEEAP